MVKRYSGGVISAVAATPNVTSAAGLWNLTEMTQAVNSTTWPQIILPTAPAIQYLIVAGGGSGGGNRGGGAGAGGLLSSTRSISGSTTFTVTVGAGAASSGSVSAAGLVGVNSSLTIPGTSIVAYGGGGGGGYTSGTSATNGGSGGGAGYTTKTIGLGTVGQGYDGGAFASTSDWAAGGGGGAGGIGGTGITDGALIVGGLGGIGSSTYSALLSLANAGVDVSGTRYIAGGGGGGTRLGTGGTGGSGGGGRGSDDGIGTGQTAGTTNTGGGGGGGGGQSGGTSSAGLAGGSGIVIISYSEGYLPALSTTGNPTITVTGGYRIYKFTSSGSITF